MTTSFADYVAQQDARNTIELNIRKYTLMLCDALVDNFKQSHPNSDPYTFSVESGRKYHKIVMETESQSRSVYAFVDKKTEKFIAQHHSKHLQRLFVSTFAS